MPFRTIEEVDQWAKDNGGEKALREAHARLAFGTDERTKGLVAARLEQYEQARAAQRGAEEEGFRQREIAAQETAAEAATVAAQELAEKLSGVTQTLYRVGQLLSDRAAELRQQADAAAKAQGRQQWALIALSVVLAISTVAYTWTT